MYAFANAWVACTVLAQMLFFELLGGIDHQPEQQPAESQIWPIV